MSGGNEFVDSVCVKRLINNLSFQFDMKLQHTHIFWVRSSNSFPYLFNLSKNQRLPVCGLNYYKNQVLTNKQKLCKKNNSLMLAIEIVLPHMLPIVVYH